MPRRAGYRLLVAIANIHRVELLFHAGEVPDTTPEQPTLPAAALVALALTAA